jgi:starch synthase
VQAWNPATDAALAARYDAQSLAQGKAANRLALQRELGLEPSPAPLLVGMVARFAGQKGTDLLPAALPLLQGLPLQFAVLGRGEARLEHALREWAEGAPGSVALRIGHDEALAHRIFAGADVFLMPSRHEPCGLTQMYAQRYGTVPVARRTGGLADTIVDADAAALAAGSATGVLFADADAGGIAWGLKRALELRADAARWRALQHAGMRRDFSWDGVAGDYLRLYEGARRSRR